MNDITALSFFSSVLEIIPRIVAVGNRIDTLQKEHDWEMKQKYAQSEYLETVLALYQSRKITGEEAKKALALIFRDNPIEVTTIKRSDDIESEIYRLLSNY